MLTILLTLFGGKRGLITAGISLAVVVLLGLYAVSLKLQVHSLTADLKTCQTAKSEVTGKLQLQNQQVDKLAELGKQAQDTIDKQQELLKIKNTPVLQLVKDTAGQRVVECEKALPVARNIVSELRKAAK